uniref:Uncharacterized protein n=1 Tax=Oryza nivara TaxID=4536 RepID=A0A0E0FLI4_ORYNI
MSLFMEGGIKELAKMPMEEIEADKLSKEDIDVRLKWLGLFHPRKHQPTGFGGLELVAAGSPTAGQVARSGWVVGSCEDRGGSGIW